MSDNNSNKKVKPYKAYINSARRESGTPEDFYYKIRLRDGVKYTKCVISNLVMYKSYYIITSPYNTFTLTEGALSTTITITEGNYNEQSLPIELVTQLNAGSVILGNSWNYAVSFPNSRQQPQTGKLTFAVSGNGGVQPIFTFSLTSAFLALGFQDDSINTFVGDTIISENPIILQGENCIYLHSDMIANENDNILQDIYVSQVIPFGSIVFTQMNYELNSRDFISLNSNIFRFRLTDENDSLIDLNDIDYQFTLIIY
jgi:hypothetical protein